MKKYQISISALFIFFIYQLFLNVGLLQAQTSTSGDKKTEIITTAHKPLIHFENPDFNFGKVYKGENVEHIYQFENKGNDTLKITRVKPSCGCTAAVLTNNTIPPGETGEIKATFKTASYGGKIKKSITVSSNDPDTPRQKLTISGEVIEDITIKPRNINFGSIQADVPSDKTISVSIKSQSGPDFKIEKITASKPFVITSIAEERDGEYTVDVTLKDYHKIGRFSGRITLQTNNTKQKKADISFYGDIEGDITTYPKRVYYGNIVSGKESTQKLFVKMNKDNLKITDIKISPDFLSIKIEERYEQNNPHCLIEMKLPKDAPTGKLSGFLELHTNSKQQPLIKIPINGMIKEVTNSDKDHGA